MKKFLDWQVLLGTSLVALSAVLYLIHYAIFKDSHHIFIYLVGDIAFVPIEVLLVTLIIHRLLSIQEKRARLKKMDMVIGAFFGEVGTDLLKLLAAFDPNSDSVRKELIINNDWSRSRFLEAGNRLKSYECRPECERSDIGGLMDYLMIKRNFLLGLLQNPNLLEHESFSDLLWAVFHLTEELSHRKNLKGLTSTDSEHLAGDIRRAYLLLVSEWLSYMNHLKGDYPYLFSLAIRTNPLDPNASVEVK